MNLFVLILTAMVLLAIPAMFSRDWGTGALVLVLVVLSACILMRCGEDAYRLSNAHYRPHIVSDMFMQVYRWFTIYGERFIWD